MNVEEAYSVIAERLIAEAGAVSWDYLRAEIAIFEKMSSSTYWVYLGSLKTHATGLAPIDLCMRASKAILFLRDNILQTTGERIWGLTFTLYKTGKFNIDYDYKKPESFDN